MNAFKCLRTGVLFPEDYYEEWGRKYGIGLGPKPVSEALVNLYTQKKAGVEGKEMYPVGNCHASVQLVTVTEKEWDENAAVLMLDDPGMSKRGIIMRERQVANKMVPR